MTGLGSGPSPRYASDLSQSDEFRIYHCKILPCRKRYSHDWNDCVFAHAGEKIQRRCPRKYQYMGIMCPDIKKFSVCPRGDTCCYAHNSFEYWLHPSRYRTEMCTFGTACTRPVCFFAHDPSELRAPEGPGVSFQMPGFDTSDGMPSAAHMQPLSPAAHFYGTPDASPRYDQGVWATPAAATSAPQLADAMAGLYLTHQGTQAGTSTPRHVPSTYPDPTAYPAAGPYPETMPYPQSGTTNTYSRLVPRSPAPYPNMARNSPHLQPSLNPPSTMHPTLRRPHRATVPTTMPLHPPANSLFYPPPYPNPYPNPTSHPALRTTPPTFSSAPYPTPHTPTISSTSTPSARPQLLLSQPSYEDPTLSPTTGYLPAPDYLPPGADPAPRVPGFQGDTSDHGDPSDGYYAGTTATTMAMLQQQQQQQALDHDPATDGYYAEAPASTMAMQQQQQQQQTPDHSHNLLAAQQYATAITSLSLPAHVASTSGMLYPYVQ